MQYRQAASLGAYRRARQYVTKHAAALGRIADSPTTRRLDKVIAGLADAFAGEVRTTQTSWALTERKHELRYALRKIEMAGIVSIAQASPGLGLGIEKMSGFRVPHIRTDDLTLLAAARSLRKAAKPNAAAFVKIGASKNFLEQFDSVVDELDEVMLARDGELLQHHKYSVAIKIYIRQGREVVDTLTAFVRAALDGRRPDLVATWFSAIRVAGKPGPARKRRGGAE